MKMIEHKFNKNERTAGLYFIFFILLAVVIGVGGSVLLETLEPTTTEITPFTVDKINILGQDIPIMWGTVLCLGLSVGWVLHGVGFTFIRL